jgi:mannose-1-phosphate guanylyltransferase
MSREKRPKQLVSLLNGRSLLTAAAGRLDDVVAPANRYVCLAPAGAKRGVMAV